MVLRGELLIHSYLAESPKAWTPCPRPAERVGTQSISNVGNISQDAHSIYKHADEQTLWIHISSEKVIGDTFNNFYVGKFGGSKYLLRRYVYVDPSEKNPQSAPCAPKLPVVQHLGLRSWDTSRVEIYL